MIGNELLLLAAALVLLFALPLALLAWMVAQYAQMRQLANRLEGLEVDMRRLHERSSPRSEPEVESNAESEMESTADSALPESEEPDSMVAPVVEEPDSMVEPRVDPLADPGFEPSRIDAENGRRANGERTAP